MSEVSTGDHGLDEELSREPLRPVWMTLGQRSSYPVMRRMSPTDRTTDSMCGFTEPENISYLYRGDKLTSTQRQGPIGTGSITTPRYNNNNTTKLNNRSQTNRSFTPIHHRSTNCSELITGDESASQTRHRMRSWPLNSTGEDPSEHLQGSLAIGFKLDLYIVSKWPTI